MHLLRILEICILLVDAVGAATVSTKKSIKKSTSNDGISEVCKTMSGSSKTCGIGLGATTTTIDVVTSGSSTWSQTFFATSFSKFAAITAPTRVTTSDGKHKTIVAAIFPGGAAWIGAPPPGAPTVEPPQEPPKSGRRKTTKVSTKKTKTLSTTRKSSTTTSSSTLPKASGIIYLDRAPPDFAKLQHQHPIEVPWNAKHCLSNKLTVNKTATLPKIESYCSFFNGTETSVEAPQDAIIHIGNGMSVNVTVQASGSCSSLKDPYTIIGSDCKYFLSEALDCKKGGFVADGCFIWQLAPKSNAGLLTCASRVRDGTGFNRDQALVSYRRQDSFPGCG